MCRAAMRGAVRWRGVPGLRRQRLHCHLLEGFVGVQREDADGVVEPAHCLWGARHNAYANTCEIVTVQSVLGTRRGRGKQKGETGDRGTYRRRKTDREGRRKWHRQRRRQSRRGRRVSDRPGTAISGGRRGSERWKAPPRRCPFLCGRAPSAFPPENADTHTHTDADRRRQAARQTDRQTQTDRQQKHKFGIGSLLPKQEGKGAKYVYTGLCDDQP